MSPAEFATFVKEADKGCPCRTRIVGRCRLTLKAALNSRQSQVDSRGRQS
jgi:hypothetical protein